MKLGYIIQDEDGIGGKNISVRQGENKILQFFLFKANGAPKVFLSVDEVVLKISKGASATPLSKSLTGGGIALITSPELGGAIGFTVTLAAADTAGLPVSSTLNMSAAITDTGVQIDEQDFAASLDVSAPLVS
jgi:hypothetical protein